jgi:6-phosphogluconolactonase
VVEVPGDKQQLPRVTLTPMIFNAARRVVFIVFGREKAHILQRVLESPTDTSRLPAQLIRPSQGKLIWLLDQEAASLLNKRTLQSKMADPDA